MQIEKKVVLLLRFNLVKCKYGGYFMRNKILILTLASLLLTGLSVIKAQTPVVTMGTTTDPAPYGNLTFRSATFYGEIVSTGSWTLNGKGFAVSLNPGCTAPYVVRLSGTPSGYTAIPFTANTAASALIPNTTYYVKAFVKKTTGGVDTAWSDVVSFTTPPAQPPALRTLDATDIGLMNATLNGMIDAIVDPYNTFTKKGFIYSKNPNPVHGAGTTEISVTGTNPNNNNTNTPMPLTATISSGLESGVTYYVRTFVILKFGASTINDTVYSDQNPFTTRHACGTAPASVIATDDVGQTTALIKWVKQLGQSIWQVDCGIVGHTPGEGDFLQEVTNDTFVVATGLTPNTNYTAYVRAVCDTIFSEWSVLIPDSYFQTLPYVCAPIAEISASQVLNTSAVIRWTPGVLTQWRWEVMMATYYADYPATGIVVKNNPEYAPFGLIANTKYKVKVRAICDMHDDIIDTLSDWSEEVVFTTKTGPDIGLNDISPNQTFVKIYPNPASGEIKFDYKDMNLKKIEIVDESGRIIATINKNITSYKFDKGKKGTFFIRIYTDEGIQNEKIIVE